MPNLRNEELHDQVQRIVRSSVFGGSESLRQLLLFLAGHSANHPGQPAKEKEIAFEVFGRHGDFDPQNDSTVRVHTGRLRSKLAEYYVGEGASDQVVVEIPRGSYQLAYHLREPAIVPAAEAAPVPEVPAKGVIGKWWIAAAGMVLTAVAGYLAGSGVAFKNSLAPKPSVRSLWASFTATREAPLIIFGNPRFVGSDFSGMRYWRDSDDPREAAVDTFTSIGDLAGVFEVTSQLTAAGLQPALKRAQLLTWDDAANRNLVIVGSPISIRTLREHPFLSEFVFKDRTEEPRIGVGAIINKHQAAGEEATYFGPDARPYQFDYAVLARVPAVNPARSAMVLAGITSHGTQAAAEFACREESAAAILSRLQQAGAGPQANFEAMLRVRVSGGVPVHSEIIALRVRQ